jgi:excisionase family DNA binding protein
MAAVAERTTEIPRLLLTLVESCETLRISRSKMYLLIEAGQINPVRIGRAIRFRLSDLEDFTSRNVAL